MRFRLLFAMAIIARSGRSFNCTPTTPEEAENPATRSLKSNEGLVAQVFVRVLDASLGGELLLLMSHASVTCALAVTRPDAISRTCEEKGVVCLRRAHPVCGPEKGL